MTAMHGRSDGRGSVIATYAYGVFGAPRAETGASANEFTFTGEQVDPTDLQYLRARYYDPAVGRFLSEDPLPLPQRYPYVGNNPANLVDPYGLLPCPGCDKIGEGIGVVKDGIGQVIPDPLEDWVADAAECVVNKGNCLIDRTKEGRACFINCGAWDFVSSAASVLDLFPNYELCLGGVAVLTIATGGSALIPGVATCAVADWIIGGVAAVTTQVNILEKCGWTWKSATLTAGNVGNFLAEGLDPGTEFVVEYIVFSETNSQLAGC